MFDIEINSSNGRKWSTCVPFDISLSKLYFHIESEVNYYFGTELKLSNNNILPRNKNIYLKDITLNDNIIYLNNNYI
jgi:hypothetical protein